MGLLDNLLRNTQQSGDFSKSLMDALNTMLTDGGQAQPTRSPGAASQGSGQQQAETQQDRNFVGALSEMAEKLQKAGYGDAVSPGLEPARMRRSAPSRSRRRSVPAP
jgi:hypothetical protein